MRFKINGKNIDVTPGLQEAVIAKLSKLDRYFREDLEVAVTLSVTREQQKVEVTIPMKGTTLHAEETSTDMYASIDMVRETIERQLNKHKQKLIGRWQAGFAEEYIEEDIPEEEGEVAIVKTKHFALKPMDPEEACLQMDMLNHNFYVFRDAVTDQVCVVYKRKDGKYGLITPEV